MRVYYHPSVGVYARYPSFEWDYFAAVAGIGGVGVGAGSYALRKANRGSAAWGLAGALVGGIIGGALVPKRILSWLNPPPFDAPLRYPRQIPKKVVPSFIGDDGQVLNLLMYDGAGDVVKDYSPCRNHGKIHGARWVDGSWGWALYFNGVDAYAVVPHSDLFETGELTILLWQNLEKATTGITLSVGKGWVYTQRGWGLHNKEWSPTYVSVSFEWCFAGGSQYVSWGGDIYYKWLHVAAVYSERLSKAELWINGELKSTKTPITPYVKTTSDLLIEGRIWKGTKGPIRIYNRALSAGEIKYHFESTRAIFGV